MLILSLLSIVPKYNDYVTRAYNYIENDIVGDFDYYESDITDTSSSLVAYKAYGANELSNVDLGDTQSL